MHALLLKLPSRLCSACGGSSILRKLKERSDVCRDCGFSRSITAGTFFHGMKKARPWLASLLMFEEGLAFSINELHRLLGIAFSTAWSIFQKLSAVIDGTLSREALIEASSIDGFRKLITRRSNLTPAKKHPVEELLLLDENYLLDDSDRNSSNKSVEFGSLEPIEKIVIGCLSSEPAGFDSLCDSTGIFAGTLTGILMQLELKGLVVSPGSDKFRLTTQRERTDFGLSSYSETLGRSEANLTARLVRAETAYLLDLHHGLSRKYLQRYIASAWSHFDRERWAVGVLSGICILWGRFVHTDIESFVSDSIVQIGTSKTAELFQDDIWD